MTANAPSFSVHDTTQAMPPSKLGIRFNKEAVRILKHWLSMNTSHPYPDENERRILQDRTGLNRTQISNWLANARRRGKVPTTRAVSGPSNSSASPIDIPARPATPAIRTSSSQMNPLERWVDSPPENEPASAIAIARAVASTSSRSPRSKNLRNADASWDGSEHSSRHTSSSRSIETSCSSGGSRASGTSNISNGSLGPFQTFGRPRSRRRRRVQKQTEGKTTLSNPWKTFQCTFCTETFSVRYDWQRHEHTLHLPLERWVCAPDGPTALRPDTGTTCCVFCGEANPDDAHIKGHNYSVCQDRSVHWRTFNRKDHLNQHLRLVHNSKFTAWPMKAWKAAMPEIRSRCGFCEHSMSTWDARVHHLAGHFKSGKTMADWKGDWGFDAEIFELVENAIPPNFIHNERSTPFPFEGSRALAETPRSAYELLKLELAYFMQTLFDKTARMPTNDEMQLEACRIVLTSEVAYQQDSHRLEVPHPPSWLQDLIMSADEILQKARFSPMRSSAESRLYTLRITGKNSLFEECPFEAQLGDFVKLQQSAGLAIGRSELREEACRIIGRMEEVSTTPSDFIATWLVKLIHSSTNWLYGFCQRSDIVLSDGFDTQEDLSTSATIENYNRLEQELGQYLHAQRALGIEPSDEELRRQARIAIYDADISYNQTAADDNYWLSAFKVRHLPDPLIGDTLHSWFEESVPSPETLALYHLPMSPGAGEHDSTQAMIGGEDRHSILAARSLVMKAGSFFVSDPNFYRWITEELGRWVKATMSPHNPACHVPTDEEIQHYARWITYNDDDPLNQTIAENQDWLMSFKRDVGLIDESTLIV
ncbi:hypothetical protein B0J13DRAFT_440362 [Dactylonectria estremocensis]|uniref:Uncharacterized protein n=1 Tax=Dactylonectria estremocensis TaxID=1079267 RepID=A0A9P9F2K8_9HYPO|nr:hypothetical protein B0J13DRAFT_440362 [Dactylonectria estremocensis]